MKKHHILYIAVLLSYFIWTGTACAATKYISADGVSPFSGTEAAPYSASQIQTAYDALSCGDTLSAKRGDTFTYTGDALIIDQLGCTSISKITFNAYGTGADPIFQGDRVVTTANSGDNFAWIKEDVDYHEVYNWDIKLWKTGWTTGSTRTNDGESSSHDGLGKINGWIWDGTDVTGVQVGFLIYGDDNAICGPADGCEDQAAGSSGNLIFRDFNILGYQGRGIKLRNGVGGAGNTVLVENVNTNGGGASYDKNTGNCTNGSPGQAGFDWGFSSGATGNTPDSYITFENCTSTDNNNRLFVENCSPVKYRQGDGFKGEGGSHHIIIRGGYATQNVDSGIDAKSDIDVYDFVSFKNAHNYKSYSSGTISGITKQMRLHNCLGHTQSQQGGAQSGAQVKAFGTFTADDSTFYDNTQNSTQTFNMQTDFSDSSITVTNTIYGFGSGLGSSLSWVYDEADDGDSSAVFTDNDGDNTPSLYAYDGEGVASGTDPVFNSRDQEYDAVNVRGNDWHPTASAYLPDVGYREVSPVTPYVVLGAPSLFNAIATSDTEISTSWTNPTQSSVQPFQTATILRIESPVGGGFSTYTTIDQEKVTSGGFEGSYTSGIENAWTGLNLDGGETFAANTANPYAGVNAQSMTGTLNFDDGIYQTITTSEGLVYNTGCWYYTATPQYFKMKAQGNSGAYPVYNSTTISEISTWAWKEFQWTKTVDGLVARVAIYGAAGITGTPTLLVDNCSTAPAVLTASQSVTGRIASTQYNLEVIAVNTIGNSTGSQDDATTTAAPGGSGESQGGRVGSGVTIGPGCSIR